MSVQPAAISSRVSRLGQAVARYGLVLVLAWIGVGKFVKMEAHVLIEHNPLMSWIYLVLSHSAVAMALGTAEILAAVLIALHRVWPLLSAVGRRQRDGGGAVRRNAELPVHHAGSGGWACGPDPDFGRSTRPVSAEGSGAHRSGNLDLG